MSLDSPIHSLVREELNVLQHVRSWMANRPSPSPSMSHSVYCKGSISLHAGIIKIQDIPKGAGWKWNQTRRKSEHHTRTSNPAVITKLIPRRSKLAEEDAPRYKLWHLTFNNGQVPLTVLYCEKGVEPLLTTPHSSLYGSNIALEGHWGTPQTTPQTNVNKMSINYLCSN